MSKSGGVFQIDDVTRTMSKGGGGAPGVPPIQVQTPPTWLAGYGPAFWCGELVGPVTPVMQNVLPLCKDMLRSRVGQSVVWS